MNFRNQTDTLINLKSLSLHGSLSLRSDVRRFQMPSNVCVLAKINSCGVALFSFSHSHVHLLSERSEKWGERLHVHLRTS